MSIICVDWKTDVMPVHAHMYYHADCYKAASPQYSNAQVREVAYAAGTCMWCGNPLSEQQTEKSVKPVQPK